jgi:hypothetical protein
MAEIRINTTGGLKLYDADNSHYAQIVAGTITSNVDAITLGHDTVTIADNLSLGSDSAIIKFGADSEITLTHSADAGLLLKHTATADDKPVSLTLQTGETDIAANDVIGAINFQAPDEGTGTDAILVAAGIEAVSEGDFSSSSNATKLSFKTGVSEAAAEKMSLSSAGLLTIADDLVIKDGGTIGVSSDADSITIASNGAVTFSQTPVFPDGSIAVADLDIDGATDIGAAIVDADLFIIDDGAGGTNRKTTASRIKTYIGSGLSETETWRVSSGANVSAGSAFFTSNWEQDDTYGAVDVGTGMTESSGVFSFPSTGIYEINFTVGFINDNGGNQAKYLVSEIHLTTDNSSYNKAAEAANSNAPEASSIYSFATTSCLFDVTNTTNDKAKFAYNVQQNFAYIGNTNYNATFVTFKRLGDT